MRHLAVPVIDISPFLAGTPQGKRQVAEQVGQACKDIGFLTIVGHGVDKDLIAETYRTSREFFNLPLEEKMKVARPAPDQVRGYSPVGDEGLSYSLDEAAPGDLKESLSIGPVDVPEEDYYRSGAAGPHFASNLWPETPAALQPVWSEYFRVMEQLSADLMQIFASALDLPEGFFEDKIDKHISMFRVLNYPEPIAEPHRGQLRAGAHSDYGSLTIVRQDHDIGGLQVRNRQKQWVDVKPIPDSFVVNIGDLMMQWTNDRWISTVHRVINPPRDRVPQSRRQSLVFFHQPNYDAMIECLESCYSQEQPAKYAPISSGDHLRMKFMKQTGMGKQPNPVEV